MNQALAALKAPPGRIWKYDPFLARETGERAELILSREAAFELGGSAKRSANAAFFVPGEKEEDTIELYGSDISEIREDCEFARLAILRVAAPEDGETLYRKLKGLEFIKYRVFPKGYMTRISPGTNREQVRIGKSAVAEGLSFFNIGCSYIKKYKEDPSVLSVRLLFVTSPACDWKAIEAAAKKASLLTESLNKVQETAVSCDSCSMKAICDEVEGLRELHFKLNK